MSGPDEEKEVRTPDEETEVVKVVLVSGPSDDPGSPDQTCPDLGG